MRRPELPGFYYDEEKNRYFPIRGMIPGQSSYKPPPPPPPSEPPQERNLSKKKVATTSKILQARELSGKLIPSVKGKRNSMEEIQKRLASEPTAWLYEHTEMVADSALEHTKISVQMPAGETEFDILLTGSVTGNVSYVVVGRGGFDLWKKSKPACVWPHSNGNKVRTGEVPGYVWRPPQLSFRTNSGISFIKPFSQIGEDSKPTCSLVTTQGGFVYILNLAEPVDSEDGSPMLMQRLKKVHRCHCTIWSADYKSKANHAIIATDNGAALVNLERGVKHWVCNTKSDVLSVQIDPSENVVLCGLRNGLILTGDVREKQELSSRSSIRRRIPYTTLGQTGQTSERWFQVKGSIVPSHTVQMPSSVSCLVSLGLQNQYFLASSMDGTVKLYDHRLRARGAVQSYAGHVNSHTRLQLGVDPSERFVISGGEDGYVRLWSIKSGELLFEGKFSDSVLSTVSWEGAAGFVGMQDETQKDDDSLSKNDCNWKAWLGSHEGVFCMDWTGIWT